MKNLMSKFLKEEEGNVIEYVIVLAVIAVIIVALFPGLRSKIMGWFDDMTKKVDTGTKGNQNEICFKPDGTKSSFDANGKCQ